MVDDKKEDKDLDSTLITEKEKKAQNLYQDLYHTFLTQGDCSWVAIVRRSALEGKGSAGFKGPGFYVSEVEGTSLIIPLNNNWEEEATGKTLYRVLLWKDNFDDAVFSHISQIPVYREKEKDVCMKTG